jgi:formamidopyrimidine-DNA glycosylase
VIELPEAVVLAGQINQTLSGKQIKSVIANRSPHKFAWFTGDPADYPALLNGKTIGNAVPYGGIVEFFADDMILSISTNMWYLKAGEKHPAKHLLLLEFTDGSAFCATVQMWGGMFCFKAGENGGFIETTAAKDKPSPLSDAFNRAYFDTLSDEKTPKLSAKAFLATEQRIPGLGNGALQDILWTAGVHPKRKIAALTKIELDAIFSAVKDVLFKMAAEGGRDTETDLYGQPGGYKTVLSKNTAGTACPKCGTMIIKEAYMGGSIYYCAGCQPL